MADCYAEVPPEERQQEMRALCFDLEGRFITSVNLACLAELGKQHLRDAQTGACFEEGGLTLMRRFKDFLVNLGGHCHLRQLKPALNRLIKAAFPITLERYASPLDVPHMHSTRKYWLLFAKDSVFGAQHDCYSVAWNGCSIGQLGTSQSNEMGNSTSTDNRWACHDSLAPCLQKELC